MSKSRVLLKRAKTILDILKDEKICSSLEGVGFNRKLNITRELAEKLKIKAGYMAPGLTATTATTLLQVGLCQELSQRFALEYAIKYKANDVHLIFLGNADFKNLNNDNHTLVVIGDIRVSESLFIGRGSSPTTIDDKNRVELTSFLKDHSNQIIADPLIGFSGMISQGVKPIQDYCKTHEITQVYGVKSYSFTTDFINNAPTIKHNAIAIAKKIKQAMPDEKIAPQLSFIKPSYINERPEKINVVDEKRQIITTFTSFTQRNQEDLRLLRENVGTDIIKKLLSQSTYEISSHWLKQVNDVNPNGITELAN